MAPNLSASQHALIQGMILDGVFKHMQIAQAAKCSRGAVQAINANLWHLNRTSQWHRQSKSLIPEILQVLREHPIAKPDLSLKAPITTF